jgi:membrane protein YqaA with SNARE-associated domain
VDELAIYVTLFANAFIAATLFPALSELAFAGLLAKGIGSPTILLIAVSTGNIAGSVLNWVLGRFLMTQETISSRYTVKPSYIKAKNLFQRFGVYSLLLAWVPIIGDPLTFVAGLFKVRFLSFITLVSIGKVTRYAIIIYAIEFA